MTWLFVIDVFKWLLVSLLFGMWALVCVGGIFNER